MIRLLLSWLDRRIGGRIDALRNAEARQVSATLSKEVRSTDRTPLPSRFLGFGVPRLNGEKTSEVSRCAHLENAHCQFREGHPQQILARAPLSSDEQQSLCPPIGEQ
ncbi:hypothetical protein MPEAHAMD_3949 [Methylobacterium frigidaeris]|uniref:Uncharacterized protein n=1 Tax=Methylobacterium frigidaeris TaxID=2038277 RepID=A0AA37HDM5_9HYPH|nr:hypothetical protein MPEAHAMD_3949 [Methylobacterium frigidaeris]